MLVYNLTAKEIVYRGKPIPANGGSVDFKDLLFIPDRDKELEKKKVLAFGSLPYWWRLRAEAAPKPKPKIEAAPVEVRKVEVYEVTSTDAVAEEPVIETKSFQKEKHKR